MLVMLQLGYKMNEKGRNRMSKKYLFLWMSILSIVATPIVFAEEANQSASSQEITSEKVSEQPAETKEAEANLSDLKATKTKMLQVYLANNYISEKQKADTVFQINEAKTSQEVESVMSALMDSVDGLDWFTNSFAEKYYNLEANIMSAKEKGMITAEQAQLLREQLTKANTLDDLSKILADFNQLIEVKTVGTSDTISSDSVDSSDTTSNSAVSTSTSEKEVSQSSNNILPKTGEKLQSANMLMGILLSLLPLSYIIYKKQ